MSFGETLFTRMTSGHAGLSALVSTRVYPVQFKQSDVTPAIRYTIISSDTPSAMGSDIGLTDYRYQFDIIGETYDEADETRIQLKLALVRWRASGVPQASYLLTESDLFDSETRKYRIRVDIRFIVEE